MKPPFFLWKAGALDVFDSVEELEDRHPPDTLAGEDFIACDSEGRILMAGRASIGLTVTARDDQATPSPDTLRNILRGYLERSGVTTEQLNSLSLAELVTIAYPPPDPGGAQKSFMLRYIVCAGGLSGLLWNLQSRYMALEFLRAGRKRGAEKGTSLILASWITDGSAWPAPATASAVAFNSSPARRE